MDMHAQRPDPSEAKELASLERRRRSDEQENQKDRADMNDLLRTHEGIQARLSTQERYQNVFGTAERKVMLLVEDIEARLKKRETRAVENLAVLMRKRPGRISSLFSGGKATRKWRDAVDRQKKSLATIRRRKSIAFAVRSNHGAYQIHIKKWIYQRAIKLDSDAVRRYEKDMEQTRAENERQRLKRAKENEKRKEVDQDKQRTQVMTLERKITA